MHGKELYKQKDPILRTEIKIHTSMYYTVTIKSSNAEENRNSSYLWAVKL